MYYVVFSKQALRDIDELVKAGDKVTLKKLDRLLDEISEHPRTGTGKPKPLAHGWAGYWSRRITDKHRLVYTIDDSIVTVNVISAKDHYDDK